MTDSNLRTLKIKSIDGQTYELTVPKDVSEIRLMRVTGSNFGNILDCY